MKKIIVSTLAFFMILGFSSMAHASSSSFDFQSGGISLHVAENCSLLSVVTTNDLIVDIDFEPSPEGLLMEYSVSVDMTLGLFGMFNYELELSNLALGTFQGFNPSDFLGDGITAMNYAGTSVINAQFGQYDLTGATLEYDVTFTPSQEEFNRYAISIDMLSLYGGNISELLSGIILELNQSDQNPIALTVPFTIPMTFSGIVNLQADPVDSVPVPAAIWLLGSGLLGLIGFKRHKNN
ncbi:MAG: PEP-CTERM sorting domain-containing protein [Desulfobacula sp.]|uniref:PEP-CTERM sorting domain-containing protein n=1 Tax=Desulfobacula sp. TaxID=2593537 RepID=UPI0025C1DA56|nr:PEP-CTERM sorting domain-containing protein [Desulfobacula sp.]MCD4718912.1 PEP-CTERM sorting domain-containing protein [Desulfobacula sp.]